MTESILFGLASHPDRNIPDTCRLHIVRYVLGSIVATIGLTMRHSESDSAMTPGKLPRSPRFYWLGVMFTAVWLVPLTFYPFLSAGHWVAPVIIAIVVIAIILGVLSEVWDIGPTFVEKAEARYQSRYAPLAYSIPVVFDVAGTAVPGISRLRIIRTDTDQTIGGWELRLNHSREIGKDAW